MTEIGDRGVPCFSGSCSEIYLENAFPAAWKPDRRLTVAEQLGETSLMFLVHPTLSDCEMRMMATVVTEVMREATA
jgi:dTDP-4-amino-4,6-dideoxygalactose transaminase